MSDALKYHEVDVLHPRVDTAVYVYGPRYWACRNGDPTRALFYQGSPQCNSMESVMKRALERRFGDDVEIVFLERAYVPMIGGAR